VKEDHSFENFRLRVPIGVGGLISVALLAIVYIAQAIRPLGPDEAYFLHHAWAVAELGGSPLDGYPFPLSIQFYSMLFRTFDFYGILAIKWAVGFFYIFLFFLIIQNVSNNVVKIIIFFTFLLFFQSRAIDIRPELFSHFFFVTGIYILFFLKDTFNSKIKLFAFFFLIFIGVLCSPRYVAVAALLFFYASLLRGRSEGISRTFWMGPLTVVGVLYFLVLGDFGHLTEYIASPGNIARPEAGLEYKIGRLLGPRYLFPWLIFVVLAVLLAFRHTLRGWYLAYSFSIVTCAGFMLKFDRVPFEYSALPTQVLLLSFVCGIGVFSQTRFSGKLTYVMKGIGGTLFLMTLLIGLYFSKDTPRDILRVFSSTVIDSSEDPIGILLNNHDLTPFDRVRISQSVCEGRTSQCVLVSSFRSHPLCLSDEYSSGIWSKRASAQERIGQIVAAKALVSRREGTRGNFIIFYNCLNSP
jgi:hypothetical protein